VIKRLRVIVPADECDSNKKPKLFGRVAADPATAAKPRDFQAACACFRTASVRNAVFCVHRIGNPAFARLASSEVQATPGSRHPPNARSAIDVRDRRLPNSVSEGSSNNVQKCH
jgi:hypothetical protein